MNYEELNIGFLPLMLSASLTGICSSFDYNTADWSFLWQNLRQTLNERGLGNVKIIGGDSEAIANEMIVRDILRDAELYQAVDIVGFVLAIACIHLFYQLFCQTISLSGMQIE